MHSKRILTNLLIAFLLCLSCYPALADNNEDSTNTALVAANQQLLLEQERNSIIQQRIEQLTKTQAQKLKDLKPYQITSSLLRHASLDTSTAKLDQTSVTLALAEVQQTIDSINSNLSDLQAQLHETDFSTGTEQAKQLQYLQTTIKNQQALLKIANRRLKILQEAQSLNQKRLELLQNWENALQDGYNNNQLNKRQQSLDQLANNLQQRQQQWLNKLAELNLKAKELIDKNQTGSPEYNRLIIDIFATDEQVNLSHLKLVVAQLRDQVDNFSLTTAQTTSVTYLRNALHNTNANTRETKKLQELVENKLALIKQRSLLETENRSVDPTTQYKLNILKELQITYQQQLDILVNLQNTLAIRFDLLGKNLRSALASRQTLPNFVLNDWLVLGKEIFHLASISVQTLNTMWQQTNIGIQQLNWWQLSVFILLELTIIKFWYNLRHYLILRNQNIQLARQPIAIKSLWISTELIRRNLFGIMIFTAISILFGFCHLDGHYKTFILPMAAVWFSFRSAIIITRLTLLENLMHDDGQDTRLYRRLRWTLFLGGIITALAVLSYQLPVAYEVQNFFNRILTIFVLIFAISLFKSRHVFPALLEAYLAHSRPYLLRCVKLLSFLLPLTIIIDAVIGLIGYVELAWTISKYAGIFLLVLALFVIAKDLLKDFIELLARFCIRNMKNGWLWSEALLKPIHGLLTIALFMSALGILFALYGWGLQSYITRQLFYLVHFPLFSLGDNAFTLLTGVKLFIMSYVIYWLGRWTREFTYRWLYTRAKNQSVRNSLSVFTQYIAVVASIFIALKMIGVDLGALALVLSSFAVAIGLGLRDFANNFVSGMWLLVERPIRKGDYVTMDDHEGIVSNIGTRAITIISNDNNEVIVPNAQIFSKTFINWTYQDAIVRIVIPLHVTIDTDPHLVQTTVLNILHTLTGVVSKPIPEVFLKNMLDGHSEFEIRFYIDLKITDSRSEMRSKALFAIYARFKELGIETPHPEQNIYVKELPSSKHHQEHPLLKGD